MLNHVLVPLDGSDLAQEAIEPAKQLIRPNGKITLVMAIDVPQSWDYGIHPTIVFEESRKIVDELKPQAKAYLEQIAANLLIEDFQVDTVAELGEAAMVILETAANRKVDVIAMSTHGRSGFSRWLFGSVTGKVLSASPCPVFVIPNKRYVSETEETAAKVAYH